MNKPYFLTIFFLFFISFAIFSQQNTLKSIKAVRVQKPPKIDGNADDNVWKNVPVATDFIMYEPGDGTPISNAYKTDVKIVYDDVALYVLAVMKDPDIEHLTSEFALRDQFVQSDYFSIFINPFKSPGSSYLFGVFSSGAQADAVVEIEPDFSWNAVWKSEVGFTKEAWIAEMKIPFSALRFQNESDQTWGISFNRHINKLREDYSWVYFDKSKGGDVVQFLGNLTNLTDLKPPVRLSFYPNASFVNARFNATNSSSFSFGMDVKYGINEAYTLEASLIPDFSNTPYDNLELNLGPFEQFYGEKRQFFIDGTALFKKADLFYSRRIGDKPINYYAVYDEVDFNNENIIDNPSDTKLINAIKITGRSKNGLGIGFLNAITNKSFAKIKNNTTGEEREIETAPFANYNVLVLDYNYAGNSSVSFINTNVIRQGKDRDADVVGLAYDVNMQNNTLNIKGNSAVSFVNDNHNLTKGFKTGVVILKKIKQHNFKINARLQDDKYNNNDLGFNMMNNYAKLDVSYQYKILKPTKHFNSLFFGINAGFDQRYYPFSKIQNDYELRIMLTNKKHISYGAGLEFVTDAYNYYEPRVAGRYFLDKQHGGIWTYVSTDYRKKFAFDIHFARFMKFNDEQNFLKFGFSPRFKFNNKFKLNYSFEYKEMNNEKGFVAINNNDIIFGNRNFKNYINSITANYYFSTKSGLNLSARYNWTPVEYTNFFLLNDDGTLLANSYNNNHDINYNVWNLDFSYDWEFAPGSKLTLMYRNFISNYDKLSYLSFGDNFNNLLDQPKLHSFIMKMTYYIDYNTVKNKWF